MGDTERMRQLICYFDYTCSYSYKAWLWLEEVASGHKISVEWRPFLLKEVNREPGERSYFDRETIESVALLALALSIAARGQHHTTYHERTFRAMHEDEERPDEAGIYEIARDAGVDVDAFRNEQRRWIEAVASEHRLATTRWGVFGTPTLVIEENAVYLKLDSPPADPGGFWIALETMALSHPELIELKRARA